jgi:hypothetical protein
MERSALWLPALPIAKNIALPLTAANPAVNLPPIPTHSPHNLPNHAGRGGVVSMPGTGTCPRAKRGEEEGAKKEST